MTFASTYVAGGDLEYGRYGNPTWTAFEDALGELEGGRCLSFASGLAAVATILDLVGTGEKVVAPRHSYNGTIMQLGDLELRGRLTADAGRHHRHRRGRRRRARTPRWSGSSRRPTRPSRWPTSRRSSRPPTRPAPASSSTTPSSPRCCSGRSSSAPTSCVHSATKYLAGHSDVQLGAVVTRDDELYAVLKGRRDVQGNARTVRGLARAARPAHAAPARRARPGERRRAGPPPRRPPGVTEVRYPGLGGDGLDRPAHRRPRGPARPHDRALGARHQPRRRRVVVRAPPPLEVRARDHPRGPGPALGRASRTSRTCGPTS